jgi:hypothetical protein
MPAFTTDSLSSYGGALFEDTPPIDSTTDRPAGGANAAYSAGRHGGPGPQRA